MSAAFVGWFCTYTPVEILEAAGLVSYGIRHDSGEAHEDVLLGDAACSFVRGCIGGKLKGIYDDLEGVVIAHSCECMRRLYDGWIHERGASDGQWVHLLDVPRKCDARSEAWFASSLARLREFVAARYGALEDGDIKKAIKRRNALLAQVERMYEARKWDPPGIRGSEFARLLRLALTEPLEISSVLLEEAVGRLGRRPDVEGRPRILIYGGPVSPRLYEYIEDAGGAVVYEHACNGGRLLRGAVSLEGDPLRALAEAYLGKTACPRMLGTRSARSWAELRSLISEYEIDGVVYCAMKFCSNLQGQWPLFREELAGGIAVKALESDISGHADRREVEVFLKRLRRRKGMR